MGLILCPALIDRLDVRKEVNGLTVKSASHEVDIQKNSDATRKMEKQRCLAAQLLLATCPAAGVPPGCEVTWMNRTGKRRWMRPLGPEVCSFLVCYFARLSPRVWSFCRSIAAFL